MQLRGDGEVKGPVNSSVPLQKVESTSKLNVSPSSLPIGHGI